MNSRFFLPFENPIGFGISDFLELSAAALLVFFALVWPFLAPVASRLARRTTWSVLLLAVAPVALRMALLANHPAPSPRTPVELSHLLVADTMLHFRLANPPHPLGQFFETLWVIQQPTYSSVFPVGQGIALAFGRLVFGHEWAGVVLCVSAFCTLCYWMLRAWTTPEWALLGGFLSVLVFGPLSDWMNSYSGTALTAAAGCLATGLLPRLRDRERLPGGVLLGVGLAVALLTSLASFALLTITVLLYFAIMRPVPVKALAVAAFVVLAAIAIMMLHDKQTTGNWTTPPASVYRAVTPEQILASRMQTGTRFPAAIIAVIVLLAMAGLKRLNREAARLIVFLCVAQFVMRYGLYAFTSPTDRYPARPQPAPGKQLVFVRYGPRHRFRNEWVYNDADIDAARVVWAHDLGDRENVKLRRYYPDRSVWLLDADAPDPGLTAYDPQPPAPETRPPEPAIGKKKPGTLRFEEVPDVR